MRLIALLTAAVASAAPPAPYRMSVQIVVDTSARMATKVGDRASHTAALEDALRAVESHTQVSPSVQVTWRTFGGATPDGEDEATCESTQLLVPPGVTAGPVVRAIAPRMLAKGPRPLSAALTGAMSDLPQEPGAPKAIVLVTSGADECDYDVCLTASDLRGVNGLGIIHVILVNPAPGAEQKLACLGKVTVVRDAKGLAAAIGDAVDAVLEPATLTVTALKDGVEVPATAELYVEGDKQPTARASAGTPLQVAGGIYDVRVIKSMKPGNDDEPLTVDPSTEGIRQHVEVASGAQLAMRIPLGGRRGTILGTVLFNGAEAPDGTHIAVFRVGDTETPLADGAPGEPIPVPPGRYDLRATIPGGLTGSIEVWKPEVSVTAGGLASITLSAAQRRGKLLVRVTSNGQPVDGAAFTLSPAGAAEDNPSQYPAGAALEAPSGKYRLRAVLNTPLGDLTAARDNVSVPSNDTTQITLDVGASALLTVDVTDHGPEDGIMIAVLHAGGDPALMTAFTPIRLPPGKYGLRVQSTSQLWGAAQSRIELRAGENRRVELTPP